MGKRHVFWRKPDGRPHREGDDKYAPTGLLAKIGQAASVTAEGGISLPFPHVGIHDQLVVRTAAVVYNPTGDEVNDADASAIVWEAIKSEIKEAGGGKPLSPRGVLQHADSITATHFRKPVIRYVLVSSLSIQEFPARVIRVGECMISGFRRRGSRYSLSDDLRSRLKDSPQGKHLDATKYQTIRVYSSGRSVFEATEKALGAIACLRGLWTFFATRGSWKMHFGGMPGREPIGVIHTGPIHTLHGLDGKLATDMYWYDPEYTEDAALFVPKNGWHGIEKNRRWTMRTIERHGYREDLEEIIRRYAAALDNVDMSVAFLQMWSILEKITNTVGARYDETISRATWVFRDRRTAKELLEHLRFRRNQYVHAAKSGEEGDQVTYLIKSFVDPHLVRLIRNDFKVASLDEYGEFLGLPTNVEALTKQRDRLQRAIRFRKKMMENEH